MGTHSDSWTYGAQFWQQINGNRDKFNVVEMVLMEKLYGTLKMDYVYKE